MCLTFVSRSIHVVGYTVLEDSLFTVGAVSDVLNQLHTSTLGGQGIATSCLALGAAVDVLIAIAMTFLLLRKRAATGFAK